VAAWGVHQDVRGGGGGGIDGGRVQQRGAAVIAARGLSSAMSAAIAISDHLRDWVLGTAPVGGGGVGGVDLRF
jgi:hypothetical protein